MLSKTNSQTIRIECHNKNQWLLFLYFSHFGSIFFSCFFVFNFPINHSIGSFCMKNGTFLRIDVEFQRSATLHSMLTASLRNGHTELISMIYFVQINEIHPFVSMAYVQLNALFISCWIFCCWHRFWNAMHSMWMTYESSVDITEWNIAAASNASPSDYASSLLPRRFILTVSGKYDSFGSCAMTNFRTVERDFVNNIRNKTHEWTSNRLNLMMKWVNLQLDGIQVSNSTINKIL